MKCVLLGRNLRSELVFNAITRQLRRAPTRGVRVLHFTIQSDHMLLIVEASDGAVLARGLQWLFSRIALTANRLLRRRGSLFRDRHHRHELETPRQVRNALAYVLFNSRKHAAERRRVSTDDYDPHSSLVWFDGWHPDAAPDPEAIAQRRARAGPPSIERPHSWLAREGWLRGGGPLRWDGIPGSRR